MKEFINKLIALGLTATLVAGVATACTGKTDETTSSDVEVTGEAGNVLLGGWQLADSSEITDEMRAMFDDAFTEFAGAGYTQLAFIASQVVAGRNYCFLCQGQVVAPDTDPFYALVYIYEDPDHESIITNIVNVSLPGGGASGDTAIPGGWEYIDSADVAAGDVVSSATAQLTGADYEAIAAIASKVTSGTSYAVVCRVTPVTPDATSSIQVVEIHEDANGTCELVDSVELDIAGMYSAQQG
ncbi:MAG: hypothetical protein J6Z43_02570 [Clostridiales bacterium]|nr:hypothetical protein [Clostridiales bacterium]